jgi:hypothetical protein
MNGIVRVLFGSADENAFEHLSLWSAPVLKANQEFVDIAAAFSFTTFVETQKFHGALVSDVIGESQERRDARSDCDSRLWTKGRRH